ncbi:COG1470 family protein [Jiangella rhizosphaerae]|uniref:Alpha-galactosidase NEW3 domain-containing protein n=1 Tax=Jiangella rhizosphaerae TaxID=2293569 RepID=A0A418KRH9_9ACTN|nr:NEW3 domain-containing protein [Jiangella rhizosphaerae]RIQ25078.1 hypothetical protein DY240_11625 [Jiangella rhizosphaerae]
MTRRIAFRLPAALLGGGLAAIGLAAPASAVEIVTPYPAVRAEAGESTTFDLQVLSDAREAVSLGVSEAPEGWSAVFRGGGREVDAVHADPSAPAEVQLEVRVPAETAAGVHQVTVVASGRSGDATLPLQLRVVEQAADAFELTTEFTTLRGSGTDTYRFDLTLANHSGQEATFALAATGPEGWNVTASPSAEQQAATATVDAGGTTTIAVEADPPDNVPAGTYPIAVQATGEGTTLQAELAAEVTGSSSFTLTTPSERLNASGSAGDTGTMTVLVRNDGNAPLQGVELSATPPSDWEVEFEPSVIEAIPPGESAQATARITPTGDAIAGDYVVTVSAASGGTTEEMDIRYAVETSATWGFAGGLIIVAAAGALVLVYRRYGRR